MTVRSAAICAFALSLAACEQPSQADVATTYRDAPRLELIELQRLCANDALSACQLGPGVFANLAPDGGIVLGMPKGPVVLFDSAGTLVAEYGREGDGPGEYRRLLGAHVLDDGRVVLYDGVWRRLLFAADGTPLATHSDDHENGISALRLGPDGLSVLNDPPAAVGDSVRAELELLRDTLPAHVAARIPNVRRSNAMGMSQPYAFFEERPLWALDSDTSALVASGPTLSIRRYFRDGRAVAVTQSPALGNRAVTPADISAERDRRMPTGNIPPRMVQPMRSMVADAEAAAATLHPFADDLRVLHDGTFLLRESLVEADSVRWTVFDLDGAVLGQLRLPARARIVGGRLSRMLVIGVDDLDVPVVSWVGVVGLHVE